MMRFLLPAALAVALMIGSAEAAKVIIGLGTASCGTWTADRRNPEGLPARLKSQWILGFLSGVAAAEEFDPMQGVDANAVRAWMDDYCRAHPLELIMTAGEAFIREHPR